MASRDLTAAMIAAISAGTIRPAIFYEGEFVAVGSPSETPAYLRLWSGVGDYSWNGNTWTGAGNLLAISQIEETRELHARNFSVTLSGMSSSLIATALNAVRQGRPGTIWLGLRDANDALIADPYQLQRGKFDVSIIEDDGQTCTIVAQYESALVDLERPRSLYYTTEDQALTYPSDLGFGSVPTLQDTEIEWG